ncbi:unnamed protein product, partial [Mesorhabditis belari]|uniref:Uncharacterized protein n=1 Tax=Mesorhabditis belari TaxID=2138241 RepID=A0AAF3EC03_9BILA
MKRLLFFLCFFIGTLAVIRERREQGLGTAVEAESERTSETTDDSQVQEQGTMLGEKFLQLSNDVLALKREFASLQADVRGWNTVQRGRRATVKETVVQKANLVTVTKLEGGHSSARPYLHDEASPFYWLYYK